MEIFRIHSMDVNLNLYNQVELYWIADILLDRMSCFLRRMSEKDFYFFR